MKATIGFPCPQCGEDNDLLAYFAGTVCGKCARKNHKKVIGKEAMNTETQSACGACGLFFPLEQADTEGFHSANYCEQALLSCCSCGYQFIQNEGVTMTQEGFSEFVCLECYGEKK